MSENYLKYLDDILMRDADTLINDMFTDEVMAIESFENVDEEYTDIDTLLCEEGFISKTKAKIMETKERKILAEKERVETEQKEKDDKEIGYELNKLRNTKMNRLGKYLKEMLPHYNEIRDIKYDNYRKSAMSKYIESYNYIINLGKIPSYSGPIESLNAFIDDETKKISECEKKAAEKVKVFKAEHEAIMARYNNVLARSKSAVSKPSFESFVNEKATEEFSNIDTVVFVTLGAALFGKIIANKIDKKDMGIFRSSREARPYYYILSNEFKKSEKSLKGLLKRNKKFITSRVVLEEIISFRKKYYNRVGMTVNRFMEVFESMESLIGKEKDYTFSDDNPIRDAAIMSRLHQKCLKFYELRHSNFTHSAAEVLSYEPSYMNSDEMGKIVVDSKYLTELLRPDETFRCINVLENIIKKIPSIDDANRYEELLINTKGEAGPLRMYTSTMLDLRDTALEVRSILNAYINVVYAILDFSVLANEDYRPRQDRIENATEGLEVLSKFSFSFNYTKLITQISILKKKLGGEIKDSFDLERFSDILNHTPYGQSTTIDLLSDTNRSEKFLGTDLNSSKKRMALIRSTTKCLQECKKINDFIWKKYMIIGSNDDDGINAAYDDLVSSFECGLEDLSNKQTKYHGYVVDERGYELIHEFNKITMDAVKKYLEYVEDRGRSAIQDDLYADINSKKLDILLLSLRRPDRSDYSYNKFEEIYKITVNRDRLSNLIKSHPGAYYGQNKKEIIECTRAAIEICDKYEQYLLNVYSPYVKEIHDSVFNSGWAEELRIGLSRETGIPHENKYPFFDDNHLGVVVDKVALSKLYRIINKFYELTNQNQKVISAIKEKITKDPSYKEKWVDKYTEMILVL